MNVFLSRKRKRTPSPPRDPYPHTGSSSSPIDGDHAESTEIMLAMLASLDSASSPERLLDLLVRCNGSVEDAAATLLRRPDSSAASPKGIASVRLQSSLPFGDGSRHDRSPSKPVAAMKPLTRRGKTLHLFSPADIAAHTPCSIIRNFLPAEQANKLLRELLAEAPTFSHATFKLFDNVVHSPHSACFYVNSIEECKKQQTEYMYNGSYVADVREILPEMRNVSTHVRAAVNEEVAIRIREHYPDGKKLKYQCPGEWVPNAAFVNCYKGGGESVGYHSDQLSYLGPRAVIGGLSLGVAREFRVRKIIGREAVSTVSSKSQSPSGRSRADEEGQIAIHLPHNSLLVMHAEMQEEWKHSIHPAATVEPHPVAGNARINVTYRWYRDSFHPKFTPRCRCGIATVLKCVQKKQANRGRYMWMCQVAGIPGRQSCGFFEWAEFTEDGEPVWKTSPKEQAVAPIYTRNEEF